MEERKTLKEKLGKLWETISPALCYRTKPGCPTCLTPIMDEKGIPEVSHCSQWEEEKEK